MRSIHTLNTTVALELRSCGSCGAFVAMRSPEWTRLEEGKELDDKGQVKGFYCPNGHYRGWWESAADRERKRAERAEAETRRLAGEVSMRDAQIRERDRKLKRLNLGVCAHCYRTFVNLQRHMQTKHPAAVEGVAP